MTLLRRIAASCLPLLALPAQDQATTLLTLARGADVIVRATVTVATDPSPEWHRLQFATTHVLKGTAPATFTLLEPAGACCGRSLFALQLGEQRLLFLQRRGVVLHPLGGARGVLPAEPALLAHVPALLGANGAAAATTLLVQALDDAEPRIADDAAHALAALPALVLSAGERDTIAAATLAAVARRSTRGPSLVEVAVRVADDTMLDQLLSVYLDGSDDDRTSLLRRGLARCAPEPLIARVSALAGNDARSLRAAELLLELPPAAAGPALRRMLQDAPHPRTALCIAERLLAAGSSSAELRAAVPAPVLELAERRARQPRRHRAIQPALR